MEKYLNSVWNTVHDDIKESIEDPESRSALKSIIFDAMVKNKKYMPVETVVSSGPDASKFKVKLDTGKGTTVSAYNLHWNDWKEENQQKEYQDPDDPTKKLTQHKYWQKHVWPNLEADEKKKWEEKAKSMRSQIKKSGGATKKKRNVSKSAYLLFLEKQKSIMDKDEKYTHPDNGNTLGLHHFLLYVWSNHVRDNEDLKSPFDEMAKQINESEDGKYDISELPYLDPEKLSANDFSDLELIEDD